MSDDTTDGRTDSPDASGDAGQQDEQQETVSHEPVHDTSKDPREIDAAAIARRIVEETKAEHGYDEGDADA